MPQFQPLLLNYLIVLFPIFVYQFFSERMHLTPQRNRWFIAYMSGGAVLLCMAFPVCAVDGSIFDLRMNPLYISYIYGGPYAGLFATVVYVLGRLWVGGPAAWPAMVIWGVALLPALILSPRFPHMKTSTKRLCALGFVTLFTVLITGSLMATTQPSMPKLLSLVVDLWALNMFAMLLSMQLIEHILATKRYRSEMIRTEKLQVISELAASIAHEVRNPMTAARGFSQLLSKSSNLSEREVDYVQMIQDELDRAHHIINEYLTFARPQVDYTEHLELKAQVHHVIQIITPYAVLRGVSVEWDEPYGDIFVEANAGKLVQALVNILKNAIEANPTDGTVRIRTTVKGGCAAIEVTDTGVGMSQKQIENLGTPFFSTKSTGTGLGLMTTYRIVQAMNGSIAVNSEQGRGTTFTVTIPLATDGGI